MDIRGWLLAMFMAAHVMAPDALAAADGVKGWCNGSFCASDPVASCKIQFDRNEFGFDRVFIGASATGQWHVQQCEWKGLPNPSVVLFTCDTGFSRNAIGRCVPDVEIVDLERPDSCENPATSQPVNILTGSKLLEAEDFSTADGLLGVGRYYRSFQYGEIKTDNAIRGEPNGFGARWRFGSYPELSIGDWTGAGLAVVLLLPNGVAHEFSRTSAGAMQPSSHPGLPASGYQLSFVGTWPADMATLDEGVTQWEVIDPAGNKWSFQSYDIKTDSTPRYVKARPASIQSSTGYQQSYSYGSLGELTTIEDSFSRELNFEWIYFDPNVVPGISGRPVSPLAISRITLPDTTTLNYGYQAVSTSYNAVARPERLVSVEHKDAVGTVLASTTYHYEDTDYPYNLTGVTDARGVRVLTVAYDSRGRVTSSTPALGHDASTFQYSAAGVSAPWRKVTNALGRETTYLYNNTSSTRLVSVTGAATANCPSDVRGLTYDETGFVATATDQEGRVTKYTRDTRGRPTEVIEAFGAPLARTTSYAWHATYDVPTQIVAPGLTTANTYGSSGQLTQTTLTDTTTHTVPYATSGQARTWTYSYTAQGLIDVIDGPLSGTGDSINYDYDANGYVTLVTNGLGHATDILSVNGRGLPTSINDPNGVNTTLVYDARGWPTTITVNPGPSQSVTQLEYNAVGDVTKLTQPDGSYLIYGYDDARRLSSIQNNYGQRVEYTYNAMGLPTQVLTKSSGGSVIGAAQAVYDEIGRLLTSIGAASQETDYAYDRVGNVTGITDPRAKAYANAFDALNRLISETDPDAFQTSVTYRPDDSVASVTDARALATTYVRNGFGDVIRLSSPDTGITDKWYDAGGRMIKRIDARGITTDFTYDGLGRMLTMVFPSQTSQNRSFTYDATTSGNRGVGRLTSFTDGSGSTAYVYDAQGRIITVTQTIQTRTYVTGYTYTAAGDIASLTYPSGRVVSYTRNVVGRISGVRTRPTAAGVDTTVASSMVYRPFGGLQNLTHGNGLALTRAYDGDGRIRDIDTLSGGTVIQNLNIAYDAASNITAITDYLTPARTQGFTYDDLNRVSSGSGAYGTTGYTYDGVGNRTGLVQSAPAANDNYAYAATSNRLLSVARSGGFTRLFSYLASGQMSADTRDASTAYTYIYAATGRLSTVRLNGVSVTNHSYDAMERRVAKALVGISTTHYIYDLSGRLLAEAAASTGASRREYVWADDLPVGLVDAVPTTPVLYTIHTDHLNRPQKITDAARAIAWDGQYRPFGEAHAISGSLPNWLMFPGQIYDSETALHQNWHRDYDPSTGRYIQSDPIGLAGGINTYAYALGNPVSSTDPTGEFVPQLIGFAIGAGLEYLTNRCATTSDILLAGAIGGLGGSLSKGFFLRYDSKSLTRETGFEWSHSIARKFVDRYTSGPLKKFLNRRGGFNGSWASPRRHYMHDNYRYPSGWKQFGDRLPAELQYIDRVPDWFKATVVAGGIGAGIVGTECGCRR
jgi:RHS repeat-associated protein